MVCEEKNKVVLQKFLAVTSYATLGIQNNILVPESQESPHSPKTSILRNN